MGCLNMGFKFKRREETNLKQQKFYLQNASMLLQEKLVRGGRPITVARIFSLTELQEATNNFDSSMIIGRGGFATVYKGFLADHDKPIAIKKSNNDRDLIHQVRNEILILSSFHHRNVVKLIGYCLESEVPLMVFEYITNGTLFQLLHNELNRSPLDWDLRLKIATETANMLSYLHSVPSTPIVHGDVKSNNIMIDHDFTSMLIDFGCSIVIPEDHDEISDPVQGTLGYLDPEYFRTGKLTEKSDVYSFGVVLVELLTRMKALRIDRLEEERLLSRLFLQRLEEGRLFEIVDQTIVLEVNSEQLIEYSKLTQACLNPEGQRRPSMKEVAIVLEGLRSGGQIMKVAAIVLEGLRFDEQQLSGNVEDDSEEDEYLDDDMMSSED